MARPLKDIDPKQVELLAGCFCTNAEIAAKLGCHVELLTTRFPESLKKGRENGKCSLRSKQFHTAMQGNVAMLIWLGKQYLNQHEKLDINSVSPQQAAAILAAQARGDSEEGGD